jgi:NAD dependent epimerase/dehydratase family enzyme
MLRLALGEVGTVLVDSQRAVPQNLLESGFSFQFPEIEAALSNIVKPSEDKPEDN